MSEGRKTQVILLDDRRLELIVQPKLYSSDLLDMVASHFRLKEKDYFGLCFKDETGHQHWLQLDRRVLDHDFPRKTNELVLYFGIRFYIESITFLRDNATVDLFYHQAKQNVYKGIVEADADTIFELAAHVLQESNGDYISDEYTKDLLKKLPVLPTSALKDHPSIAYCEDQVIQHYKNLIGHTRGAAIVNYMHIVEGLPTYGIHYYDVKDKAGFPWWLGLSHRGISQYDFNDKRTPRKVFPWKQLENLYFRDKKFSIEVHDAKRVVHTLSSFNLYEDAIQEPIENFDSLSDAISDPTTQVSVSRRTFGPSNVNVYAWFAKVQSLTKCIWSMAVSQHQFYLDRKQSRSQLPAVRSMSEIAADFSISTSSLPSSASGGSLGRTDSAHSLTSSYSNTKIKVNPDFDDMEGSDISNLREKKEMLEEKLRKRLADLREICLQESALTGQIPPEMPLEEGEQMPQVRKRVTTRFSLAPNFVDRQYVNEDEKNIAALELDFNAQQNITTAAKLLALDTSPNRSIRKKRKDSFREHFNKLRGIERNLNDALANMGRAPVHIKKSLEDSELISPINSPAIPRTARLPRQQSAHVKVTTSPQVEVVELDHSGQMNRSLTPNHHSAPLLVQHSNMPISPLVSSPASPQVARHQSSASPPASRHYVGYTPNPIYQTRTQYRNQMYPTISLRSQSSASNQSEYDNINTFREPNRSATPPHQQWYPSSAYRFPDGHHNLYNTTTLEMRHYDSGDELMSPEEKQASSVEHDRLRLAERSGSLDSNLSSTENSRLHLNNLRSSRFGSKRDSIQNDMDNHGQNTGEEAFLVQGQEFTPTEFAPGQDYTPSSDTGAFSRQLDRQHSHHSNNSAGSYNPNRWPSGVRQQQPPSTPQYESPPPAVVQHDPAHSTYQTPTSPQTVTVTKYKQCVEVSKPFEMSDFYKYSEKFRKQKFQVVHEKFEAALMGKSSNSVPSPGIMSPISPYEEYTGYNDSFYSPVGDGPTMIPPSHYNPSGADDTPTGVRSRTQFSVDEGAGYQGNHSSSAMAQAAYRNTHNYTPEYSNSQANSHSQSRESR